MVDKKVIAQTDEFVNWGRQVKAQKSTDFEKKSVLQTVEKAQY